MSPRSSLKNLGSQILSLIQNDYSVDDPFEFLKEELGKDRFDVRLRISGLSFPAKNLEGSLIDPRL